MLLDQPGVLFEDATILDGRDQALGATALAGVQVRDDIHVQRGDAAARCCKSLRCAFLDGFQFVEVF
ncbi:hypothetical protein [Roseovarius sp. A-2]|uniref:hypothetical protein n=1 Tax=Roseovarius sp. A-2 TaxID=1570360 RepID=UPI0009B52120|nr:hypothetical protein [Roseovarius sp. A-2]